METNSVDWRRNSAPAEAQVQVIWRDPDPRGRVSEGRARDDAALTRGDDNLCQEAGAAGVSRNRIHSSRVKGTMKKLAATAGISPAAAAPNDSASELTGRRNLGGSNEAWRFRSGDGRKLAERREMAN